MSKTVRITCAIVDKTHLTMYKENGDTIVIPQGDVRMKRIVDEIGPQLLANGFADVDLSQPQPPNSYKDFEEKSSGVVKLFRIAKSKLASLFGVSKAPEEDDEVPEVIMGKVPPVPAPVAVISEAQALANFQEVMRHATPVTHEDFDEDTVAKQGVVRGDNGASSKHEEADAATSKDTIIAVIDGKVVPGMEKIKSQFAHAAKNSPKALEAFLKRLSNIKRSHSVEDLLKFMERGDLPIADDGSIIIYKILKTQGGQDRDTFYDCHTGKVPQKVGSYVCMDESLVDPVRSNECSNGLHVARRGYLSSFSGNIMVLAKVAPEDVITVPSYDANKMRVCGYHIILQLPPKLADILRRNHPMTNEPEGRELLAAAIAGKHIGRTEEVRIRGQRGADVLVTPLVKEEAAPVALEETPAPAVVSLDAAVALEADKSAKEVAPDINPLDVVKEVKAILSRKEQAKVLYDALSTGGQEALDAIHAFKKASKTSWEKLGLPEINGAVISLREPTKVSSKVVNPKPTPQVHSVDFGDEPADRTSGMDDAVSSGSYKDRIQKLLALGQLDKTMAEKIFGLKKQAKKSWEVLGVSQKDADTILSLLIK